MAQPAAALPIADISDALNRGRPDEAERLTRTFLASAPTHEDGLTLLGITLQQQGRSAEAAEAYGELTRLFPLAALHWNNLGNALRESAQGLESEQAYKRAIELDPRFFEALMNIGYLFMERGIFRPARDYFMRAHALRPGAPEARIHAAHMCYSIDDRDLAEQLIEPWPSWPLLNDELSLELAILMIQFGNSAAGTHIFERLLRENPNNQRAQAHLATMFERVNRLDDARAMLAKLPALGTIMDSAVHDEMISAHASLALREKDPTRARQLIEELARIQKTPSPLAAGQAFGAHPLNPRHNDNLYFALAKACDKQGDVDATMDALAKAHAIQVEMVDQTFPDLLEPDSEPLFTANIWIQADTRSQWPPIKEPSVTESPVFIVGFPRSGTTMLEQMLDAHPTLQSMDERAFLQNLVERMSKFGYRYPYELHKLNQAQCVELRDLYWSLTAKVAPRAQGQRLVDKNPLNMLRLPLINRIFPNAPIILALRHPCDVVMSCYMQHFRSMAFAALCSNLDRLSRGYVNAMNFWSHHAQLLKPRMMELRYEDLLANFEHHSQRIADFIDLQDSAPLLQFHSHARSKGYISTPSYTQVIEPPNTKAVDRWRRYHKYFEPVLPTLRPIIQRWGYHE